ncbi:MAG: potassium channel family protein [Proteobacteria bacterium]|nr:potassium channel family protein [Pseudomonadota bacterium]
MVAEQAAGDRDLGRFAVLLGALVLLMVLLPFLTTVVGAVRFRLLITAVLLAGTYAMSRSRRVLMVGLALGITALVTGWFSVFYDVPAAVVVVDRVSSALFLSLAAGVVLVAVLREQRVTTDTILGGICVYLLIALIFVLLFSLVEFLAPNSFQRGGVGLTELFPEYADRFPTLLYFSFVTITTLGYGDVSPVTEAGQMLSAGEAVLGQVYLVVFVARLVGLHISQSREISR